VGERRDLLMYPVRRLLENGAESSFVYQLSGKAAARDELLASPLRAERAPGLALPRVMYGASRPNSHGADHACAAERKPLEAVLESAVPTPVPDATPAEVESAMVRLANGWLAWNARTVGARGGLAPRPAGAQGSRLPEFGALLANEAGET